MSMRKVLTNNNIYSLFAVQGQLQNPTKNANKEGEVYYQVDIKIPRVSNEANVYGTGFNRIHAVIAANTVEELNVTDEMIKNMKGNEVYVELQLASRVDQQKKDGQEFKFNNVRFYVSHIELVQEIKTTFVNRSVSVAL